ncbi:MAG TPA: NAD-dependent epimerase/dehydratase family protein, partial [Caldilineae bacterium]|nr:NAD-dependent epimerase/dehydratase family protein [Caldilineae bacterium]
MKCLVTGCAGFIGSTLTDRLLADGCEVIGIDSFTSFYETDAKRRNLASANSHPRFHLAEIDLVDDDLAPLLEGVDIVYHIAGQPGVRGCWGDHFAPYARNNIRATERLLHHCVGRPLKRFVFAGSSSIYGDAPDLPWKESTCPAPRSPYAITKLASEHLCQSYQQEFAVPTAIVRYFTVYGPRQRPDMAFNRFFQAILADQPITLYGDGKQTRDFTYVDDIVAGTIAAAQTPGAEGGVFNLGGGSRITMNELFALLEEVVGRHITIER